MADTDARLKELEEKMNSMANVIEEKDNTIKVLQQVVANMTGRLDRMGGGGGGAAMASPVRSPGIGLGSPAIRRVASAGSPASPFNNVGSRLAGQMPRSKMSARGRLRTPIDPNAAKKALNLLDNDDPDDDPLKFKFMRGNLFPTSDHVSIRQRGDFAEAPADELMLDFVYGYNGRDTNMKNLQFHPDDVNKIVYYAAAVGIVYNIKTKTQCFFQNHHTNDISSMAISDQGLVATGQMGKWPLIFIWDMNKLGPISSKDDIVGKIGKEGESATRDPADCFHEMAILALDFDSTGEKLVSIGGDVDRCFVVWEWRTGVILAKEKGHNAPVYACDMADASKVVTCGEKHIKFWNIKEEGGNTVIECVKGSTDGFEKANVSQDIYCVAVIGDDVVSGTADGSIYIWDTDKGALKSMTKAHKDACQAIGVHNHEEGEEMFEWYATGGAGGTVRVWNSDHEKQKEFLIKDMVKGIPATCQRGSTTELEGFKVIPTAGIKAIDFQDDQLLVGTEGGEIYLCTYSSGTMEKIMDSHFNDVAGLAPQPGTTWMTTTSQDRTVRVWDTATPGGLCRGSRELPSTPAVKGPDGSIAKPARESGGVCCDFSADKVGGATHLAVGFIDGRVGIFNADVEGLDEVKMCTNRDEQINDLKYSPDGRWMACSVSDNFIDIYDVQGNYKRVGVLGGHSSSVLHIDFSQWNVETDDVILRSTSSDYELLYWKIWDGKANKPVMKAWNYPKDFKDMKFETNTCILGYRVHGVWKEGMNGTDINMLQRSSDRELLVTADDNGKVTLFPYPCFSASKCNPFPACGHREYQAHSSHVTNCCWTEGDEYVVTTGGHDCTIMQWKHIWPTPAQLRKRRKDYAGTTWDEKRIESKFKDAKGVTFDFSQSKERYEEGFATYDPVPAYAPE